MNYPGNPSLGDEVRQRILATFAQSLELAQTGRPQEAALGCDFILELDPQFKPAAELKERLADGGQGLDDLQAYVSGSEEAAGDDDLFDLDSLDLDGDLDGGPGGAAAESAPVSPADPAATLQAEIGRLFAARDFQGVLERAGEQRELVMANAELRQTVEAAQSRLEAQPYVESFLKDAGAALRTGDGERARIALDKAQSLDASHPLIAEFEEAYRRSAEPEAGAPADAAPTAASFDESRQEPVFELGADDDAFDRGLDDGPGETGGEAGAEVLGDDDEDLFAGFEMPDLDEQEVSAQESPVQPPPAESPVELDLGAAPEELPALDSSPAEASAGTGGESDDRIAQLLGEGQEAADRGDYQTAIDAWSRIFLIDVDHEEAARRIEDARRHKAEREREVEEIFHDGLDALERGEKNEARTRFEKVLEVQPNHLAAREYLQQIESGGPVTGPGDEAPDARDVTGDLGSFDLSDLSTGEGQGSSEPLKQEILVPPAPGEERPSGGAGGVASAYDDAGGGGAAPTVAPRRVAAGARSAGRRMFVLIGGAVLVLVVVVAWFVLQNKERFFPNSTTEEAAQPAAAPGQGVIERAKTLHDKGNTGMALAQLKRIRPDQAEYEEAQKLIAAWEAPAESTAQEQAEPAVSPKDMARRADLIDRAAAAFGQQEYLRSLELYGSARSIAPLDGQDLANFRQAAAKLEPLKRQIELFHQGEYEMIMPELWRLLEENPANRDARRLLVSSYYNRGVRELQRGDAARAAAEFQEALSLAPDDEELQRHYLFAKTYEQRSKDLLYRIYVKYLPFR